MTSIMERGMEKADLGENVQTLKEIKQKKEIKKRKNSNKGLDLQRKGTKQKLCQR